MKKNISNLYELLHIIYIIKDQQQNIMQAVINNALKPNLQRIPKLPRDISAKDVQLLEDAVNNNITRKVQSSILKILLVDAYRVAGNDKFSKQISDLGFQYLQNTPLKNEARFRICCIVNDSLDSSKLDIIKFHVNQFDQKVDEAGPFDKSRFVLVKTSMQALKQNYYKAAIGYYYASKEDILAHEETQKIQFIQKSILMCFLAEKTKELHQLICQLYTNAYAKKTALYPLLTKLYLQSMIDVADVEAARRYLPSSFQKQDSNRISLLSRAIFRHNMLQIKQSFESISLQTLSVFTNIKEEQLQLLIETTYSTKQMQIDQLNGFVYIKRDQVENQTVIKSLFDKMQDVLARTQTKNI